MTLADEKDTECAYVCPSHSHTISGLAYVVYERRKTLRAWLLHLGLYQPPVDRKPCPMAAEHANLLALST